MTDVTDSKKGRCLMTYLLWRLEPIVVVKLINFMVIRYRSILP